MSRISIDTVEIGVLAAAIETLKENIDPSVPDIDQGKNCGQTIEELMQLLKKVRETKSELKTLMEDTVQFLKNTQVRFDDADKESAVTLLTDMGVIKENT